MRFRADVPYSTTVPWLLVLVVMTVAGPVVCTAAVLSGEERAWLLLLAWLGVVGYWWYLTLAVIAYRITVADGQIAFTMLVRTRAVELGDVVSVKPHWDKSSVKFRTRDGQTLQTLRDLDRFSELVWLVREASPLADIRV